MAKSNKTNRIPLIVPGISNYRKLQDADAERKKDSIHRFNPFFVSTFNKTTKQKSEAEPLDYRFLDDDLYQQLMLTNGMFGQGFKKGQQRNSNIFSYDDKRRRQELIKISSYDKLDEVIQKLSDECVVTMDNERFAEVKIDRLQLEKSDVKEEVIDLLEERAQEVFDFMYNAYGFKDEGSQRSAWSKMYQYLIEGKLGYELVYNDMQKPSKIIGVIEVDPLTFKPFWKDGVRFWVQDKELDSREKTIMLYDSQLVFIDWSEAAANNKFSYVEGLVRSFNVSRILDEAKIIWHVTNSLYRTLFVIPTKGKSRIKAAQTLAMEQQRHRDDIQFDYESGELKINGLPNQEFQKQYFMSEGDSGKPDITTVGGDGPDMGNTDSSEFFDKKFYRNSRIPYSRFDDSGDTWNLDASSQLREEITFGRFVSRIRATFGKLLLKPVMMQLAMDFPAIKDDPSILESIGLNWASYSVFEELMQMDVLREKVSFIGEMRESLQSETSEGDSMPFFSMEFLVQKWLPEITTEDLKTNKKYREAEQEEKFARTKEQLDLAAKYEDTGEDDNKF